MVFADAGFGQDAVRRSRTGIVFMLWGAIIFSKSGTQMQLSNSTRYAETIALHEAAHLIIVYREILANLGYPQIAPASVYEDKAAAVCFANQNTCIFSVLSY